MHLAQAKRYFPMPDYDLSEPQAVKMTIHGRIVDLAYSRLLLQKTDLSLVEILALDRVQKKLPLDDMMVKQLRRAGLIEGRRRRPLLTTTVSSQVRAATLATREVRSTSQPRP